MSASDDVKKADAELLAALKAHLPALETILRVERGHWGLEDNVYRFYHHSLKVYHAQIATESIVAAFRAVLPGVDLNPDFLRIVEKGTGHKFEMAHNLVWHEMTRPILEALFHALFFLEMAVKYATELGEPPTILPSGWALMLYLYNRR